MNEIHLACRYVYNTVKSDNVHRSVNGRQILSASYMTYAQSFHLLDIKKNL